MNWTNLFKPHILERGYHYFLEAAVEDLKIGAHQITAIVSGTFDYQVEIMLENQEIVGMQCSCPYAEDGNYCKHMAAVLYDAYLYESYEEDSEDGSAVDIIEDRINHSNQSIENLVNQTSETVVKAFLTSVLENQPKLLLRFKSIASPEVSTFNRLEYVNQIQNIVNNHMGRDRFINYHQANAFIDDVLELLYDDVQELILKNDYLSAFELSILVFQMMGKVEMDDSDGGTTIVANQCFEIWENILKKADSSVKRTLYSWFINHLDGSIIDYLEEFIESAIMELFLDQEFIQESLVFTEKKLSEVEANTDAWSINYHISKWATHHMNLLLHLNENRINDDSKVIVDNKIEQFAKKYWKFANVRKLMIIFYERKNDYDKVIEILNESIQLDIGLQGLVNEYRMALRDVYKRMGNREKYLEQLWELIRHERVSDISIYKELKSQFTASEWVEKREQIFIELQNSAMLPQIYDEEKMYDRLLQLVLDSKGLGLLQHYERALVELYPTQLLEKYRHEVNLMAIPTTDRKRYNHLVSILKNMKRIKGGKEVVSEITQSWRFTYNNRPAMMDELSKI